MQMDSIYTRGIFMFAFSCLAIKYEFLFHQYSIVDHEEYSLLTFGVSFLWKSQTSVASILWASLPLFTLSCSGKVGDSSHESRVCENNWACSLQLCPFPPGASLPVGGSPLLWFPIHLPTGPWQPLTWVGICLMQWFPDRPIWPSN